MDERGGDRLPFIGATVLYILSSEDAARCALAAGQSDRVAEARMQAGQRLPAIVTKVFQPAAGFSASVNAQVFPDGPGTMFSVTGVPYNSIGMLTGSWSWPD
jgi:hypothetical protein